ncbi:hypothetical protein KKE68_06775 [Patescibacteria group bacterium]|nr:hypothetical protein [Patescibacteria group bacterium]
MDKVKCAENNHLWVCKEESGFLNEIITFQSLTPEEITNLRQDVKNEEMICTKGTIICSRCSECLNKDHHPKNRFISKTQILIKH